MSHAFRLAVLQSHPIQYFAPLYRRLAQEAGVELTVFFCSRQGLNEYLDPDFGERFKWDIPLLEGFTHKFLPNLRKKDKVGGLFSLINPSIIQELARGRFDALLVHGHAYATELLAIGGAKLLDLPVLVRCDTHSRLRRPAIKAAIRRPLMKCFYRWFCQACLPIGTANYQYYREHGVPERRLFRVPYVVDNDFFRDASESYRNQRTPLRKELGWPLDQPVILFASKLIARKRPHDLLQAFALLRQRGDKASLVFVGSGPEEAALKSYVQQHSVPEVFFMGFRNQSELPKFYALADVFVLPSENEPWGLIINEVMCAGLPVIATEEIGAVPDLVKHEVNGFIYKAGDVSGLAGCLRALVTNPDLQTRMGQRSMEIIADWTFERAANGFRVVIEELKSPRSRLMQSKFFTFTCADCSEEKGES
jgi:glycosyltransferase involved in cell wall biosynthesis